MQVRSRQEMLITLVHTAFLLNFSYAQDISLSITFKMQIQNVKSKFTCQWFYQVVFLCFINLCCCCLGDWLLSTLSLVISWFSSTVLSLYHVIHLYTVHQLYITMHSDGYGFCLTDPLQFKGAKFAYLSVRSWFRSQYWKVFNIHNLNENTDT